MHFISWFLRLFPPGAALVALSLALYGQQAFGQSPCALCVLQRYAYFGVLLLGLLCALFATRRVLQTGLILFSLLGSGVAAYHLWVLSHPSAGCGRDVLGAQLNRLIFADWFPDVFVASGFCSEKFLPILGLSLPAWSLLGMLAIFCTSLWRLSQAT
jgi:disulfide bond formation protein DsbB